MCVGGGGGGGGARPCVRGWVRGGRFQRFPNDCQRFLPDQKAH